MSVNRSLELMPSESAGKRHRYADSCNPLGITHFSALRRSRPDPAPSTRAASLRQRGPFASVHRTPIAIAFAARVTRRCTILRMSASPPAPLRAQTAPHCRAHFAPQCPPAPDDDPGPLNRRCGSDPPCLPASISRSPVQRESGFRPAGAGLGGHTPRTVSASSSSSHRTKLHGQYLAIPDS